MHPHHEHWGRGPRVIVKGGGHGAWFGAPAGWAEGPPWAEHGDGPPEGFGPGPGLRWLMRYGPGPGGAWGHGTGWGRGGRRARRGEVRSAILALLSERPMHGYEIITELSQRSGGFWQPSPGSIYPTLQMLEDEGLVRAEPETEGSRRRFSLTEEGRRAADQVKTGPLPWEQFTAGAPGGAWELRRAARSLFAVVAQVGMAGGPQEHEQAVRILEDTRRRLYSVMAAQDAGANEGRAGEAGGEAGGGPPAGGES